MTELETMKYLIANITRYMKEYAGKVVNDVDPESKSRVMIIIPDLGITVPAEGVWADVEQAIGRNVIPKIDDWVTVFFLNGDPSKPVVRGKITTAKDNVPQTTDRKLLLYKDDNLEIMLNEDDKKLEITSQGDLNIDVKGDVNIKGTKITVNDHLEVT